MIKRLLAAAALLVTIGGCATSTAPGAVGVERSQLMMVPSATINAQAAEGFTKLTSAAAQAGKLDRDAAVTARVRGISSRLIAQVGVYRPEAVGWSWQVNVIDSEKVNAFCMPGGKIAVFSGLITRLDLDDAELAAVIGHEIAHALREHSREKVSQKVLSDAVVQGIAVSRSRYAGTYASAAQLGSILFVQLPYSREMESEADVMGLELMARAGYDPKAASNVWVKMQKLEGGSGGIEFLATHPSHENRIVVLEATRTKVEPLYARATGTSGGAPPPLVQAAASAPAPASPRRPTSAEALTTKGEALVAPATASALARAAQPAVQRRSGESSWEIEQMGRRNSCDPNSRAWLVSKEPGVELYTYQCNAAETWSLRCEFRQCRIVK